MPRERMFFQLELTADLTLLPRDMGRRVDALVEERLRDAVEGKVMGESGYVVCVLHVHDSWKGAGALDDITGSAHYKVRFSALVFKPFKNEVVDAIVENCNQHGFYCKVGPMTSAFVSRHQMPSDVQEFVADQQAWVSSDGAITIKRGGAVRMRIIQVQTEMAEIKLVGTINDNFLGMTAGAEGQ